MMHARRFLRPWMIVLLVPLLAAHAYMLYRLSARATVGVAAVSGIILLLALKHAGLFGSYAFFRRRSRH